MQDTENDTENNSSSMLETIEVVSNTGAPTSRLSVSTAKAETSKEFIDTLALELETVNSTLEILSVVESALRSYHRYLMIRST